MSEDFMSQEEIDALLRGKPSDDDTEPADSNEADITMADETSRTLDLSGELSDMERDTLAEIGNISMGSAATALSTMVNRKVNITVPEVAVSTPSIVKESYPVPCIIVNVQYVRGLRGQNLLVIKERDALVIGNLMMGEDGTNLPETVDELYLSAVTEAMNMMMGSAATSMSDLFHEVIDISPPTTQQRDLSSEELILDNENAPVVTVAFRIEIENLIDSTMLQLVELSFAKDMVQQLMNPAEDEAAVAVEEEYIAPARKSKPTSASKTNWDDLKPGDKKSGYNTEAGDEEETVPKYVNLGNVNVDLIKDIPVQVRAVLGRTRMSIDNILKLGPGHIMELETLEGEPIDVFANDTLIARGEVVVVGEQFGIRITEIAAQRDRIDSIG